MAARFAPSYYVRLLVRWACRNTKAVFKEDIRRWLFIIASFGAPLGFMAATGGWEKVQSHLMESLYTLLSGPTVGLIALFLSNLVVAPYKLALRQRRHVHRLRERLKKYTVRTLSITYDPVDPDCARPPVREDLWAGHAEERLFCIRLQNECAEDITYAEVYCERVIPNAGDSLTVCYVRNGGNLPRLLTRGEHLYVGIARERRVYSKEGHLISTAWDIPIPLKGRDVCVDGQSFVVEILAVGTRVKPIKKRYEFGEHEVAPYFKEL